MASDLASEVSFDVSEATIQSCLSFAYSESTASATDERTNSRTGKSSLRFPCSQTGNSSSEIQWDIPSPSSHPANIKPRKPLRLGKPAKQFDNQSVSCPSHPDRHSARSASLGLADKVGRHDRHSASQSPRHSKRDSSKFNGAWVIIADADMMQTIDPRLQRITIKDDLFVDGLGQTFGLIKKRQHTLLAGGALFLSSDRKTLFHAKESGVGLAFRRIDDSQ